MEKTQDIAAGQRWTSATEPELGIGVVLSAEYGQAEILFPAAEERRIYALETAPIKRVEFAEGDKIKTNSGQVMTVNEVEESEGRLIYHTDQGEIPETELSDVMSFSKPEERLLAGVTDPLEHFDLRVESLEKRSQLRKSPIRGFTGARVELIPHQFYIADEVTSRLKPRVLLADEVGLGKTIEACMILHRLHLTGRAGRILILVPEPLIHQWFVELLRRFNLLFNIFDEERCLSIEEHSEDINPFLDSQLVLCSTDYLSSNDYRAEQCIEADWDLLVVDEAHHLEWSQESVSKSYELVDSIAQKTEALLLLTATPQQLGPEGHFARLRLLDPDRYSDLNDFQNEGEQYEEVATIVDRIIEDKISEDKDDKFFDEKPHKIKEHYEAYKNGSKNDKEALISELLDSFGTGRVMFRNTREVLQGFPERKAHLYPLEKAVGRNPEFTKIEWLAGLLKEKKDKKVLLICKTKQLVESIHDNLLKHIKVKVAKFHEDLSLIQRDRNAAYFSEEDGASILICSEIGSEGRNFQFAHDLVLYDLPDTPELLEQRIGRLDRIGQTSTINIHVPYIKEHHTEAIALWHHEALNSFEKNTHGGSEVYAKFKDDIDKIHAKFKRQDLDKLIKESHAFHLKTAKKLEKGYDRLLTLNSSKPERAWDRIEEIKSQDTDQEFEDFLIRLFEHFNLHIEELDKRKYYFNRGNMISDAFPTLPDDGQTMTFDRKHALHREDIAFISQDHPMVTSAVDMLLSSEDGNAVFGIWENSGEESIYLEVYYVAECVAPPSLHVDRFFPPTALRVAVDHSTEDFSRNEDLKNAKLSNQDIRPLLEKGAFKKKLLPAMLKKAEELGRTKIELIKDNAIKEMSAQLDSELERLENLSDINDHISDEEVSQLKAQKEELQGAISEAHIRSDAVRLIWRTE